MVEPKPVLFKDAPRPRAVEPGNIPRPVVFPAAAPPLPPAPAPAPAPLSFAGVTPPAKYQAKPIPNVAVAQRSQLHADAIDRIRQTHAELFALHELSIVRQIQQLLPLKLEVVLDWGSKTIARSLADFNEASLLLTMITSSNISGVVQQALSAIAPSRRANSLIRMFGNVVDPLSFEPVLRSLVPSCSPWIASCNQHIEKCTEHTQSIAIKAATLGAAADSVGTIADHDIDRAIQQRRLILMQSVQQSELTTQQLVQTRQLVIDQRLRIDQLLTVTLPAWKAANGR